MGIPYLGKPPRHGCGDPGHEISFACMFDGSTTVLKRAFAAEGNRRKWTWYGWVKRSALGTYQTPFGNGIANTTSSGYAFIRYTDTGQFEFHSTANGSTPEATALSTPLFRDPSGWAYCWLEIDTTQATAADRIKLWVNGAAVAMNWTVTPAQNLQLQMGRAIEHAFGRFNGGASLFYYFGGYLAETGYLDGITLGGPVAAGAGYINRFGIWVPKRAAWLGLGAAAFGAQGSHLNFGDPLALGADTSGTGNHYTSVGLTAANQVTDTPTHGYSIFNPIAWSGGGNGGSILSSALTWADATGVATAGQWKSRWASLPGRGGLYYAEIKIGYTGSNAYVPANVIVGLHSGGSDAYCGASAATIGYRANGNLMRGGAVVGSLPTYTVGDTITIAYAPETGSVWFGKNAAPDIAAVPAATGLAAGLFFGASSVWVSPDGWTYFYANFGQRPYSYTPPAGYGPITTTAMVCPAIKRPDDYFTIRLASAGASVTDLPWNPTTIKTLVISKRRDSTTDWRVNDTLRPGRAWATNTAVADFTEADGLTFTATGYTIGANAAYAGSRVDYCFRASRAAGFDMLLVNHVNGIADVVPHAVGGVIDYAWVVPVGVGGTRRVFHRSLGAGQYLQLNGGAVVATDAGWFASSPVDLTLGASLPTGQYALYLWRAVPGFSAFGAYGGNSLADGSFFPTDFSPRLAIIKTSQAVNPHYALDVDRAPANPITSELQFGTNGAENTITIDSVDFDSNGLKQRSSTSENNTSGNTLITVAAWAKTPGKFARAR